MTTPCPTCGKPVDPLRAPAVGVRDGKVISYCSRECAAAAESRPIITSAAPPRGEPTPPPKRARTEPPVPPPSRKSQPKMEAVKADAKADAGLGRRTPGSGVPKSGAALYDSGPVIEIVHEPASGVVTSAADARSGKGSTNARAETSGAIQIADTGHLDDYVSADEPLHKSRAGLVILIVLLLGGGGFAAYHFGYLDSFLKKDGEAATPAKSTEAPVAAT